MTMSPRTPLDRQEAWLRHYEEAARRRETVGSNRRFRSPWRRRRRQLAWVVLTLVMGASFAALML
jgi:hypothetical protein